MVDVRQCIETRFGRRPAILGMVHVRALPGCVGHAGMEDVTRTAVEEAAALRRAGVDAVMIENMHDRPYLKRAVGPEITAAMTAVAMAVRHEVDGPLGVQILGGANLESLAVALAAGADFVRCEGYVYGHLADEGYMDAQAGALARFRKAVDAESVLLFADVKKKHASHAVSHDTDIVEHATTAAFFRADGVVVTGTSTGKAALPDEVRAVHRAVEIPTLLGSGATPDNLADYWPHVDAVIVGSYFKRHGKWDQPLDPERIARFMDHVAALRG